MLPPEIQRVVLLILLAATAYLLILAWNEDMEEARVPITYDDAPVLTMEASKPIESAAAIPELAGTRADGDIPDQTLLTPSDAVAEPAQVVSSDRLVTVESSHLKVWIDVLGGDIVRVQLPQYPVTRDAPDVPYLLLEQARDHTYIAQSGLIGPNGLDSSGQRPLYSPSSRALVLSDDQSDTAELVLSTTVDGVSVNKVFSFTNGSNLIEVSYQVVNQTSSAFTAGLFTQIKRDATLPSADEAFPLAPQPYLGAAFTSEDNPYHKVDFSDLNDGPYQETTTGGWVAFLQHYFLSAWVADKEQNTRYYARRSNDGHYLFGMTGSALTVQPGESGTWRAGFYAGPKDQIVLGEIAENLNLTVDYGILWWIAIPLFLALTFFHDLVGNWGVAIILLTLTVKASLYWVSDKGYRSMANLRRVAPAMKRLQERYANDREKLTKEMMALYKKEGANPLGGCLPMLLPMPIFLALYWVLLESVELRQAPFIFWIEDLSAMDPYFVLPLLMGGSTYLMQALNPQAADPMQAKIMKFMPIMFTILFLFFPSGLVLYWLVNNLLSLAQQTYVYRREERARA
ncbi:MAG TPA: membrane protein insertase YidC [Gammaproteobacteria bacterium]|nr:membrane protein insertase YidC [Gammaproteobacteria bacterium]